MDPTADNGTRMGIPEGSLISMESLVESDVCTRRKTLVWCLAASLRFHWVKDVGEQPIDWQNWATGALDRLP
jgi:hypothetical protein